MHAAYQYDRDSNSACDVPGWLQTGAVMNTALFIKRLFPANNNKLRVRVKHKNGASRERGDVDIGEFLGTAYN
jgi:hypothetical protein